MQLDTGLIAYAALASFAVGSARHRADIAIPMRITRFGSKAAGSLLLVFSAWAAFSEFGANLGAVVWTGQLCIAAVLMVLLLSWRPRMALTIAVPALLVAVAL